MPKSGEKRRPRRGSAGFWPRKRAKRIYPRIRSWPKVDQVVALGHAGYKVGMTHMIVIDNRKNSPTYGEEIWIPVTIIETPPLKVCGIRFYKLTPYGYKTLAEVWAENLHPYVLRKIPTLRTNGDVEQRLKQIEQILPEVSEMRLIVHTQPWLAGIGKKTPEVFEIAIGGENIQEKFEYAKELLGNDLKIQDVFKEGMQIDVSAVTKGKGFQGEIKRFGVKLMHHKAEKKRRKAGNRGPEGLARVLPTVPMPGQMGFHTRTEYNKWLIKISDNPDEINPKSGWPHYGIVRTTWIAVKGSVPGPAKRLIRLRHPVRPNPKIPSEPPQIVYISTAPKN